MLTDKHLLAEYKEITRPFGKVRKRMADNTMGKVKIPETYVLGAGHETFFFNKLRYLWRRYDALFGELIRRGVNLDRAKFYQIHRDLCSLDLKRSPYWNDWEPSQDDIYLNFARLCKRSKISSVLNELAGGNG